MIKTKHFISLFAIMMTFTSCLTACTEDNMENTSSSVSETNSLESSSSSSSSDNGNETKGRKVSETEWKESLNDIFSNWLDKYVGYLL